MSDALEKKIVASLVDDGIPCLTAWGIAEEMKVGKRAVGDEMDRLGIRIHACQLGCFDKLKATHAELADWQPSQVVIDRINSSLVDNRLPCAVAFKIAESLELPPREVGDAASKKNIRVSKCQLGAFP